METEKKTETENLFIQTCPTTDYGSDYKQKCSLLEPLARRRSFIFVRQCGDTFLHIILVFSVGDHYNGKLDIVIIIYNIFSLYSTFKLQSFSSLCIQSSPTHQDSESSLIIECHVLSL